MRIAVIIVIGIVLLAAGFFWLNRPQFVSIHASLPDDFPASGFSHQTFERLLGRFVDTSGHIDYDSWHQSPEAFAELDTYLAAVSAYSPENSPHRFPTREDELAYWMYGYNAYVISSVLTHWPIDSVTDVKAPLEVVSGLGFFYRLRYNFGGQAYSLYAVENKKIREQYRDARIHFVLNCASESCPIIRPELPTGDDLEAMLARATDDFINSPANVGIDHNNEIVHLSAIFDWYENDFINELRSKGRTTENGVLDYVAMVAGGKLREDIARTEHYSVQFHEFDWRVNASEK